MASVLNANLQQYRTAFEKGIKNVAAYIPNAVFCAERYGRTRTLYFKVIRLPHIQRCRLFSERVGPRIISIS